MTYIKKIKTTDNNEHVIEAATVSGQGYGTCSSTSVSGGITTMLVEMNNDEYDLCEKCVVAVRFTMSVPANAKMDIERKGAKPIYNNGYPIEDNIIKAGRKAVFVYDGNYYNLVMAETDGDNVKPDWEASEDASNGIKNKPNVRWGGAAGDASTAIIEGDITNNVAIGQYSHAEGTLSRASGEAAHSEGSTTRATGDWSHSEGIRNIASGEASHSEGYGFGSTMLQGVSGGSGSFPLLYSTPNPHNLSVGDILSYNFIYVYVTSTPTNTSFTTNETMGNLSGDAVSVFKHGAIGQYSHKEGRQTRAIGDQSHSEGNSTMSFGISSHAEGDTTTAYGEASHAEGVGTVTSNEGEHAEGKYNRSSTGNTDEKKTISSIGIGTDDSNRVNAVEVMSNGDMYVYGVGGYVGTNPSSAKTLKESLDDVPSGTVTSINASGDAVITVTMPNNQPITTSGTISISHNTSGAIDGSYGDSSNQTPGYDSTFKVPYIEVNSTGHITSVSEHTVKIPASDNTDRYVNSASFTDVTDSSENSPVKMTLTRAGSDTQTVTANIPKVSSSSAGVAPKGKSVSTQTSSTKFLREDGSWAIPSYTVNTTYTLGTNSNYITLTSSSGDDSSVIAPFATKAGKLSVTQFQTGDNLNNFTSPGAYGSSVASICQSLLNKPSGTISETRLDVFDINEGNTNYVFQRLWVGESTNFKVFERRKYNTGWTAWVQTLDSGNTYVGTSGTNSGKGFINGTEITNVNTASHIGTTDAGNTEKPVYISAGTPTEVTNLRAQGNNIYAGTGTTHQCHMQYDDTNKCLKFLFD